jgi:hypothetical protein
MSQVFEEIARGEGQTLHQLAKLFPPARRGRPVSLSCILRWVLDGTRTPDGRTVRLEAARCSGRWLSTPAAIQRFLAAQTPPLDAPAGWPRSAADQDSQKKQKGARDARI